MPKLDNQFINMYKELAVKYIEYRIINDKLDRLFIIHPLT